MLSDWSSPSCLKTVLSCVAETRSNRLVLLTLLIATKKLSFTSILSTLSAGVTLFLPGGKGVFLVVSCCLFTTAISETDLTVPSLLSFLFPLPSASGFFWIWDVVADGGVTGLLTIGAAAGARVTVANCSQLLPNVANSANWWMLMPGEVSQ